ncbi:MAG: acetoacetate decarboxylase family protein [Rhodocyclaceae bacterium]|jgi:hypothetical protein|nr:acetoacetate decarboxylase family protein [Rhodocyclaceae bacterium]MCA3145743.1 acetoacetate decarboxylase family protein [Rhodocyclaceae bacterium]
MSMTRVPAPWSLDGEGFILCYRFPRDPAAVEGLVPEPWRGCYLGGLGAVMLVDYRSSDVGPYRELLVVPGRFRFRGQARFAITRIYVSTQESVFNGRENWGIPKDRADFHVSLPGDRSCRFVVRRGEDAIADVTLRTSGWGAPFTTALVPAPLRTLVQPAGDRLLATAPGGQGWVGLSGVYEARVNGSLFPDFTRLPLLAAFHARHFRVRFPAAQAFPAAV